MQRHTALHTRVLGADRAARGTIQRARLRSCVIATLALLALVMAHEKTVQGAQERDLPMAEPVALPGAFEPNVGQTNPEVKFLSRGRGKAVFLTPEEIVLASTPETAIRIRFVGASPHARVVGEGRLPGRFSYFVGPDPANWIVDVTRYKKVRYLDLYPGVDLLLYFRDHRLEYDFIVAPGADPGDIRLDFVGAELSLGDDGSLAVRVDGATLLQPAPHVYQLATASRAAKKRAVHPIPARYAVEDEQRVAFRVAAYDPQQPLVIDPLLLYSTYFGGSQSDEANAIAVDAKGAVFLVGSTNSLDFPTGRAVQRGPRGSDDVFVTKLNASGKAIVYSTYLGGSRQDSGYGIAVDRKGFAYVAGETDSEDFPTKTAFKATSPEAKDAFVAKLSPAGKLKYSTFLGGSGTDSGRAIAVTPRGEPVVTGKTWSTDFPIENPIHTSNWGNGDVFVTKLDRRGKRLIYSTYLGGFSPDEGNAIALDQEGAAYVTGRTFSFEFPTAKPIQPKLGGFAPDAFVAKIPPLGGALLYSTYLGGSDSEDGKGIAVDETGAAFVVGITESKNFPTVKPFFKKKLQGRTDGFLCVISPEGESILHSTYLGGSSEDRAVGVAVNGEGGVYLVGSTWSKDFPTKNSVMGQAGLDDLFVAALHLEDKDLLYSTYLGGSGTDDGAALALGPDGMVWVAGSSWSSDVLLEKPKWGRNHGWDDIIVAKFEGR